ncbi:hypothetical protein AX17_003827 [Amanita inopinata Kibby_2008]|nr:hypothetical protein AX17_003827 [Amanita inopinata Kibby_2008]
MADLGAPPVIPTEFQQYNSYVEDPKWQIRFSIIWTSVLGGFVLVALPRIVTGIRNRSIFKGLFGIQENTMEYERVAEQPEADVHATYRDYSVNSPAWAARILNSLESIVYWSPPGLELNAGQIFVICAYIAVTVVCIICNAPLIDNSNRAGFLAIAQLPPLFLFATKNSILSFLLGPGKGYEKLNFIHRWAGRCLFLGALLHGTLWIRNHIQYGLPIIGQQKETSGIACFGLLCILVVTSLRPVRRFAWNIFWIVHFLGFIAFFITLCYHTIYARPWIYPPLALYGLDLSWRMLRIRIKDAVLVPVDKQMTLIHIPYPSSGWIAGQHVRLRVFFQGRLFESHPLTIMCAPPSEGCLVKPLHIPEKQKNREQVGNQHCNSHDLDYAGSGIVGSGIVLGARAVGDWTRALNEFAFNEGAKIQRLCQSGSTQAAPETPFVPVHVMIDGPYGGCSIDASSYETILLVSGGSGATFSVGLLDSLVGKCMRGDKTATRKIEFVWFTRSYGSIHWFSTFLKTIATHAMTCANLDFHMTVYVTCLCVPDAVPDIPNCDVLLARPTLTEIVHRTVDNTPDPVTRAEEGEGDLHPVETCEKEATMKQVKQTEVPTMVGSGGFAVCASGPEKLTREAANAVAGLMASRRGRQLGRIGLHTELYAV